VNGAGYGQQLESINQQSLISEATFEGKGKTHNSTQHLASCGIRT
jgi:hypothetical protein